MITGTLKEKEDAREVLQTAVASYIKAAEAHEMDDDDMTSELENVFTELGKNWDILAW